MSTFGDLKKIWKKLGVNGHVKNFSSTTLWVLTVDDGRSVAHVLGPMSKSPPEADADGFRRHDGRPIEGHGSWWKIYDVSNAEVMDDGVGALVVSAIARVAANDEAFAEGGRIRYDEGRWGVPIRLVTDIRRDKKKRIVSFHVSGVGWVDSAEMLAMACRHEVDNARPVFPRGRKPFVRTRRDQDLFNNLESMGIIG